ncbi:carboxylesterase [Mechercharimyces sp. CAU 1602]|uniref:alpha/beta hydrolase n=1 Tax=Mechercharimyces sp. CAU 1602 TaxID=2973933 RepID=UPI002163A2D7|nr:alpha/beta fold hydrolase [Mechercharimyces sp. CAU 1602]MCS1352187.1 alpha/beta fold hydrolase [Mechercharimyces sp. CAU 1602]
MKIVERSTQPFLYSGGETGILLVHGFTGSPSELRPLGKHLHEQGYTVHAPLLAGHGSSPEEMEKTGWEDWWGSVLEGYNHLQAQGVERIIACGLSMGGALVLHLAHMKPLAAVIPMCAPIWVQDRRAPLADVLQYVVRFRPRGGEKPAHIEQHIVPYDRTPMRSVASLRKFIRHLRKTLPHVTVPALVVQARQDETVRPESGQYIFDHIASENKQLIWYEKSSHIITVDRERKQLFEDISTFIQEVLPAVPAMEPDHWGGEMIKEEGERDGLRI